MEPAPPKAIEAIVGLLIPPACRQEILGDLHERYTSRSQYAIDALTALPLLILSRIRRTTDYQVLLMEAFALYMSLVAATWQLDRLSFLYEQQGFLRLAIPTAVALVALMLGDAYASPGKRSPLRPILVAALSIGFAFASQAALAAGVAELAVPRWIMISGGGMSLLLISTLRVLFPPDGDRPRGAA